MKNLKSLIRKLIPKSLFELLLSPYHLARAIAANIIYGFPARSIKIIGITGTNGKTTSANFIANVLQSAGYRVGISTTANFRIGDKTWDNELNMTTTNPFALQKLLKQMKEAEVEWVVLEVTSHALKQHRIWGVPIEMAVMTNLSPDHLDYHKTMENYAASKAKLFRHAREAVVLNRDDEWFDYFHKQSSHALYSYGTHEEANVRLTRAKLRSGDSLIKIRYGERVMDLTLHMPGQFNVYNALAAAAVGFGLEIDFKQVISGLESVSGVPGRMEKIDEGQNFSVIVDYAHTSDAFEKLFNSLRPITRGKLIAVFGGAPTHDYKDLGRVAGKLADSVIVTDDEPMQMDPVKIRRRIINAAKNAKHAVVIEEADRREGIRKAFEMAKPGDTVTLLCLGHQKYRRYKDKKIVWDDREVARELLKNK